MIPALELFHPPRKNERKDLELANRRTLLQARIKID